MLPWPIATPKILESLRLLWHLMARSGSDAPYGCQAVGHCGMGGGPGQIGVATSCRNLRFVPLPMPDGYLLVVRDVASSSGPGPRTRSAVRGLLMQRRCGAVARVNPLFYGSRGMVQYPPFAQS